VSKDKPSEAEADAPEGEDGEAPAKKKIPLKLMIIGGVAAVVMLGGGGTAAALLLGGGGGEEAKAGEHAKPKKAKGGGHGGGKEGEGDGFGALAEGPEGVVFYALPPMVANIRSNDGKTAYLKLKLTLELPDQETADSFAPNAPRLNDMFTTFLREVREEDLAGSDGTYQLRQELQRRVNLVIAPAKVNAVLIEEMLVQ
jgi:flagellar protein FliL